MEGNNFKPLRGFDLQVVHELLKDVTDREMTIQEMMAECKDVKSMKEIDNFFEGDRSAIVEGRGKVSCICNTRSSG